MKRFLILTCALALSVSVAPHCAAGIIPLTIDSTNSFLNLSIDGQTPQPSSASGTATLDLPDHSATSGNAQLTSLDLTLDQGFSFPLFGGFATGTTQAGDLSVSLVTPGAAGTIVGGTFDQLANQLSLDGDVSVASLLAPTMVLPLSTVAVSPVDFDNISISQVGNVITITGTFEIAEELDPGLGATIPLVGTGQFVASGIKPVPEPGSAMVLIGMASVLLARRRR